MRGLTIFVCASLLFACASAPVPQLELDRARDAIARADSADATDYAPVDYKLAREGLEAGRALLENRKNEAARLTLQRAEARAELAVAKSNGARLRAEVQAKEGENANLRRELLGEGQVP
jgi:hypothetical protein